MLAKCFTSWQPKPWGDDRPEAERLRAQGAMGPDEFMAHYKKTGGKVDGVGRP